MEGGEKKEAQIVPQLNHGRLPNCPFYSGRGGAANVLGINANAGGVEHT